MPTEKKTVNNVSVPCGSILHFDSKSSKRVFLNSCGLPLNRMAVQSN